MNVNYFQNFPVNCLQLFVNLFSKHKVPQTGVNNLNYFLAHLYNNSSTMVTCSQTYGYIRDSKMRFKT